jgi:signal transduction histidine kinase
MPDQAELNEYALHAEIGRMNKIIQALMNRAESSAGIQGSDFNLFQTAITLEDQVRRRTDELEAALRKNEKITRALRENVARRVPRTEVAAPVRIETDEYLELAVADNGPGIASETLPKLFQPFVQGDGRLARSHGGTGIGLVLVRLLAELHGGGSSVESKSGAGAKFLVWLPISKQQ